MADSVAQSYVFVKDHPEHDVKRLVLYGAVSEWFKEAVLKTADGNTSEGSKPSRSATI